MAFNNNRHRHDQTPGADIASIERDEFGYTEGDYLRMMDNVAVAIVDEEDEVLSSPQLRHEYHGPSVRYDVSASRSSDRGSVQRNSHVDRAGVGGHGGGNLGSEGCNRLHPYNRHRQTLPSDSFGSHGDAYPTPLIPWQNGSSDHSQKMYAKSRPSAFGDYGGALPSTPFAHYSLSNPPSRRYQQDRIEPQTLPPSMNQSQSYSPAMPIPQPLQQSPQYGASAWHRELARSAVPQQFAAIPNTPSPYATNAVITNAYSRPQINPHPIKQSLQAQAGYMGSRGPTVPVVDDEVEDGDGPLEEEDDEEAGEVQEPITVKGTKKFKKASKATKEVRKGLTRINADGELEWLATLDSEGVPAVTHDEIRPQLIAMADAERVALGLEYEHPDEPGPGKYNVTSFYRKHVRWGPDREDRPEIDFDWEEDKEKNPRPPKCPGYMYWEENGKKYVVLDPHDNPVKDWDIPATIASNIPGYKLEAMRRENMSLGHKDFWARMQRKINVGTEDRPIWEELGHPNSIVNMPMERFRFHAGLCSWTERKMTLIIKAGLKKLYGDKLQNNTIRGFGRDLTTNEIKEIKKGDKAVFPIERDVVRATRKSAKQNRSKGAAKHSKGGTEVGEALSRKRKHATDDEEQSLEEETLTKVRSHKRARHGRKDDSMAAEVDDLVMFEESATIEQADATRRYSFRSSGKDAKTPKRTERIEELSGESSAGEEYMPTQRYSLSKASRTDEEDDYVPVEPFYQPRSIQKTGESHRESDKVEAALRESSVESDDEEMSPSRFPFRRIPRAGEVGGKSKGPSWVSSTGENNQSNEGKDYRHTAVPITIEGRVHYATYEGLVSNGPAHSFDKSGALHQCQALEAIGAPLAQHKSHPPQPDVSKVMTNLPSFNQRNLEKDTPLQTHKKRARDFNEDKEVEAYTPPLKRLRTEQRVLPPPGSTTHRGQKGSSKFPPQVIPAPTIPLQVEQSKRAPPAPQTQLYQTRKQKLDAEWAQVFELNFVDLGYQSVNYSEVPPWNEEEVQSLIDALLPTREVYFAWTGEPAPKTDPQQSYRKQFDTVYGAFQDWWRAHRSREPLPILAGVMHWGRSVEDWEPPSKDSIYFEAFKKGHRAPNGQVLDLPDWPGSRYEDACREE